MTIDSGDWDTFLRFRNSFLFSDCNDALAEEAAAKEHEKLLVIPEKASSFRYHPEKLCEDQCFYCGGKFGLFDTPCHVAQIKSADRQKKILDSEYLPSPLRHHHFAIIVCRTLRISNLFPSPPLPPLIQMKRN